MNSQTETKLVSPESLLSLLELAVEEAKLVRSIADCRETMQKLKSEESGSQRIAQLIREVSIMELKLTNVRRKTNLSLTE